MNDNHLYKSLYLHHDKYEKSIKRHFINTSILIFNSIGSKLHFGKKAETPFTQIIQNKQLDELQPI